MVKPLLERGLKESSAEYRDLCIEVALQYPNDSKPWLIDSATDSRDPSVRHETMRALMRSGNKHLRIILIGLGDSNDQVRAYYIISNPRLCRTFLETKYNGESLTVQFRKPEYQQQVESILHICKELIARNMPPKLEAVLEDIISRLSDLEQ